MAWHVLDSCAWRFQRLQVTNPAGTAAIGEINGGRIGNDEWLVFRIPVAAAPVPEPETWAMMGVGLAGLAFAARRRKKAA